MSLKLNQQSPPSSQSEEEESIDSFTSSQEGEQLSQVSKKANFPTKKKKELKGTKNSASYRPGLKPPTRKGLKGKINYEDLERSDEEEENKEKKKSLIASNVIAKEWIDNISEDTVQLSSGRRHSWILTESDDETGKKHARETGSKQCHSETMALFFFF